MDVYINTDGAKITKEGETFYIQTKDSSRNLSPQKIKTIAICARSSITSDAIELAVKNNVDIVLMDSYGMPYGRFWHAKFGSTSKIRRNQLNLFSKRQGFDMARGWVVEKIETQISHLKKLSYKRKSLENYFERKIIDLNYYKEKIQGETYSDGMENINVIMGYEGNAAKVYYGVIAYIIPDEFKFEGRSTRPAKDPYNAFLNYAFGILYSKVEKSCVIAGLDPYIGIFHSDNYGKKSLVFDIIEKYRYFCWETVFNIFSRKLVNNSHFSSDTNSILLSKEGKNLIVTSLIEKPRKKVNYNGRYIENIAVIQYECHQIANVLLEGED